MRIISTLNKIQYSIHKEFVDISEALEHFSIYNIWCYVVWYSFQEFSTKLKLFSLSFSLSHYKRSRAFAVSLLWRSRQTTRKYSSKFIICKCLNLAKNLRAETNIYSTNIYLYIWTFQAFLNIQCTYDVINISFFIGCQCFSIPATATL